MPLAFTVRMPSQKIYISTICNIRMSEGTAVIMVIRVPCQNGVRMMVERIAVVRVPCMVSHMPTHPPQDSL